MVNSVRLNQRSLLPRPAIAPPPAAEQAPRIVVVVPARDEAGNICQILRSLLTQDYPLNRFSVLVIDDHSNASERRCSFRPHIAATFHFRVPFWYGLLFPPGYTIGASWRSRACAAASGVKSVGKAGSIHERR
jgi:cellulose synthase/poly-beta-1,6-N-acetylglucosamine synthase-like glycosyltransferase